MEKSKTYFTECKGCQATGNCPRCKGSGEVEVILDFLFRKEKKPEKCPRCNGTGICSGCNGSGVVTFVNK